MHDHRSLPTPVLRELDEARHVDLAGCRVADERLGDVVDVQAQVPVRHDQRRRLDGDLVLQAGHEMGGAAGAHDVRDGAQGAHVDGPILDLVLRHGSSMRLEPCQAEDGSGLETRDGMASRRKAH